MIIFAFTFPDFASSISFLFNASLSAKGFDEYAGFTADTKAIALLSGAHATVAASVEIFVSWLWFAAFRTD